jgi:hypothetical protein
MIIGIISLIVFIVGFILLLYGGDEGDLLLFALGIIMSCIGFFGIIFFIGINIEIIKQWFTI